MKKFLVGLFTFGTMGFGIFALGYFRQFLEREFNNGSQYNFLECCSHKAIDYSIVGTYLAGLPVLLLSIFFCYGIYKIGDYILSPEKEDSK